MEIFKELYEREKKVDKEIARLDDLIEKYNSKKIELENKLNGEQTRRSYISGQEDVKTMG